MITAFLKTIDKILKFRLDANCFSYCQLLCQSTIFICTFVRYSTLFNILIGLLFLGNLCLCFRSKFIGYHIPSFPKCRCKFRWKPLSILLLIIMSLNNPCQAMFHFVIIIYFINPFYVLFHLILNFFLLLFCFKH